MGNAGVTRGFRAGPPGPEHVTTSQPPPLPTRKAPAKRLRRGVLIGLIVAVVVVLISFRPLRPFSVPTGAMAPAIEAGDRVMMERVTFLVRKPHRGDIIVFRTDGIRSITPQERGSIYVKRIAGMPGERLDISDGKVYINDKPVPLRNAVGEIDYLLPAGMGWPAFQTNVSVPSKQYHVLGDNSTNSYDSRSWGFVPAENVMGRVWFCYWPPNRVGRVR